MEKFSANPVLGSPGHTTWRTNTYLSSASETWLDNAKSSDGTALNKSEGKSPARTVELTII
jgi:hypothetical protein